MHRGILPFCPNTLQTLDPKPGVPSSSPGLMEQARVVVVRNEEFQETTVNTFVQEGPGARLLGLSSGRQGPCEGKCKLKLSQREHFMVQKKETGFLLPFLRGFSLENLKLLPLHLFVPIYLKAKKPLASFRTRKPPPQCPGRAGVSPPRTSASPPRGRGGDEGDWQSLVPELPGLPGEGGGCPSAGSLSMGEASSGLVMIQ